MKKKNKTEEVELMSDYELDGVWMSYRYCIGRGTIAAHARASDIAQNAYGRMTNERTQFMSEDINNSIYEVLRLSNWIDLDYRWNIPTSKFKPFDILVEAMNEFKLHKDDDFLHTETIIASFNETNESFDFEHIKTDRMSNFRKSLGTLLDLEVWARLANLFDLEGHKFCKLVDGTVCEYYECYAHYYDDCYNLKFKKHKVPVWARGFNGLTWIDEQFIMEDNIKIDNNERKTKV